MSLPQHVTYQRGGTIWIDLSERPSAVTVRILDGDGTEKQEHTAATISTIDTSLANAASPGDTEINVDSNTGISAGSTCWIQDDPEEVLVRSVDGATVRLRHPVRYEHVNSAAVEGCRVEYTVPSSAANSRWWDGCAEWNVDGSLYYSAVECTQYPLRRMASAQDVFDVEPRLYDLFENELDLERHLDVAHEHVLASIAKISPSARVRVFTGSMAFRRATALAALYLYYRRRPGDAQEIADRFVNDLSSELESAVATTPRDADQDRVVEDGERISFRSIKLVR